jgi:hypothetical protein
MAALLIQYAHYLGYECAIDYVKRCEDCEVGHVRSLHKSALAMDLNLYLDGEYVTAGAPHGDLHEMWDLLGGAKRIDNDMNHYSVAHDGMR